MEFGQIEDLVQEAYFRFYKNYEYKLSGDSSECKRILLGICLNIYREWVRSRVESSSVEYVDEYDYENEVSYFEAYENDNFDEENEKRKSMLREAINTLNSNVKQVLELRFIQQKTRKEVARIMNITEDQVHTYQKRGVKYLKEILNKENIVPPQTLN